MKNEDYRNEQEDYDEELEDEQDSRNICVDIEDILYNYIKKYNISIKELSNEILISLDELNGILRLKRDYYLNSDLVIKIIKFILGNEKIVIEDEFVMSEFKDCIS